MTKLVTLALILLASSMVFLAASSSKILTARAIVGPANSNLGTSIGQASGNLEIAVSVGLFDPQLSDSLNQILEALYSPQSSNYHNFLTSQQYSNLFAPTTQAYQQAVSYFQSQGLSVYTDKSRLFINLDGTINQFQSAFATNIQLFKNGNTVYYANTVPLSLPSYVAPYVTSAIGFDNYTMFHPMVEALAPIPPYTNPYQPQALQSAYNETSLLNSGTTGAGQNIVLVGAAAGDPTGQADLAEFSVTYGLPVPTMQLVYVNATATVADVVADPSGIALSALWDLENALDIEWAHALAPNAGITLALGVEEGPGLAEAIATVIAAHTGSVVSQSFGLWEADANNTGCCGTTNGAFNVGAVSFMSYLHPFYQMAAATGITVLASSGDSGSTSGCCSGTAPPVSTNYPAIDPFVTAVGGTSLAVAGCSGFSISLSPCGGWQSESAWSGSGGGFSTVFARPSWQTGFGVPVTTPAGYAGSVTLANGAFARAIPDVAADANPNTGVVIVLQGVNLGVATESIGGTSLASPIWGGIIAMLNSYNGQRAGLFAPTAYQILNGPVYTSSKSPFHDVTSGNNLCDTTSSQESCTGVYASSKGYNATAGWDPVTGVGTPNVGLLLPCVTSLSACLSTTGGSSSGVSITDPTSGQTVTSSPLIVSGSHSLGPANFILGPPNAVSNPQLNILAAWLNNYQVSPSPGSFNVNLNVSSLVGLSTPPAGSNGEDWEVQFTSGGGRFQATMLLSNVNNATAGVPASSVFPCGVPVVGVSFCLYKFDPTSGTYAATAGISGTYSQTAPGTISMTIPISAIGPVTTPITLTSVAGVTGTVINGLAVTSTKAAETLGSFSYMLGDPLIPNGYVQVALNNNFQGATNATLVNYPSTYNWQASLNLAGLQAGAQTVYARQVINGVPGSSTSASFVYNPVTQRPPALTVATDAASYTAKQNVIISGLLVNPANGTPVSGAKITVEVTNPFGSTVFLRRTTTTTTGAYSTSYHLPKSAIQGVYKVFASSSGNSVTTSFIVDNAPPTITGVQVTPPSGNHNTVFTVSANSTDNVAVMSVYALIKTSTGQIVENVSLSHQSSSLYSATFTLPQSALLGNYVAEVHSVDVAGKTAVATSNTFTLTE